MTTELYGAPVGFQAYDQDQARLAQMAAGTDLTRAQTAHQQTLMDLNRAQTGTMLKKSALDDAIRAAMAKAAQPPAPAGPQTVQLSEPAIPGGPPMEAQVAAPPAAAPDPRKEFIDGAYRQATVLRQAGLADQAARLIQHASAAEASQASAEANRALQARRESQVALARLQKVHDLFSGVKTEAGHKAAVMTWMNDPELSQQELPDVFKTWNPQRIAEATGFTKARLEEAKLKVTEAEYKSRDALRRTQAAGVGAKIVHDREMLALRQDTEDRRAREGGGGGGRPSGARERDYDYAASLLKQNGISPDAPGYGDAKYALAEDAMAIMTQRKGISRTEAFAQALEDAKKSGALVAGEPGKASSLVPESWRARLRGLPLIGEGAGGTPGSFTPRGAPSRTKPAAGPAEDTLKPGEAPLPTPQPGAPLQVGKVYLLPDGSMRRLMGWDKDGKSIHKVVKPAKKVSEAAPSTHLASADEGDEDEEDLA